MIGGSGIFNAQRPGHNERNIPAPPVPSQDPFTRFLGLTLSPPTTELENQLARIWKDLLALDHIGIHDNFFELGGHSLLSVQLVSHIEEKIHFQLSLRKFLAAPTIAGCVQLIKESRSIPNESSVSRLVSMQSEGAGHPLFLVHEFFGDVSCYSALAECLGASRPVFGLQAPNLFSLTNSNIGFTSLEKLSADCADEIRRSHPEGPCFIGGWSFGGNLAFAIAQQLLRSGHKAHLMLFDATPFATLRQLPTGGLPLLAFLTEQYSKAAGLKEMENAGTTWGAASPELALLQRLKRMRLLPDHVGISELALIIEEADRRQRLVTEYQPPLYPAEITLFSAAGQMAAPARNERIAGWESVSERSLRIYPLTGDHWTILQEPHVGMLAEKVNEYLAV
jgi:thioesterase domain-containing protein/acyl carrier protein